MKTLIVTCNGQVRFLVTNHPEYRFKKLQSQMPVEIHLFGVTDCKAKDIKLRFATQQVTDSEWYKLNDDFESFLAGVVNNG